MALPSSVSSMWTTLKRPFVIDPVPFRLVRLDTAVPKLSSLIVNNQILADPLLCHAFINESKSNLLLHGFFDRKPACVSTDVSSMHRLISDARTLKSEKRRVARHRCIRMTFVTLRSVRYCWWSSSSPDHDTDSCFQTLLSGELHSIDSTGIGSFLSDRWEQRTDDHR